jgi:hypothetical protein
MQRGVFVVDEGLAPKGVQTLLDIATGHALSEGYPVRTNSGRALRLVESSASWRPGQLVAVLGFCVEPDEVFQADRERWISAWNVSWTHYEWVWENIPGAARLEFGDPELDDLAEAAAMLYGPRLAECQRAAKILTYSGGEPSALVRVAEVLGVRVFDAARPTVLTPLQRRFGPI